MAVHAVQFVMADTQEDNPDTVPSPGPPTIPSVAPDRVSDAISGFSEVFPGESMAATHVTNIQEAPDHIRGLNRFDQADDKAQLLDALEAKMVDLQWTKSGITTAATMIPLVAPAQTGRQNVRRVPFRPRSEACSNPA